MKHVLSAVALTLTFSAMAQPKLDLRMDVLTSPHMGASEFRNEYKVDHVTVDGRIGIKGNPYKLTGEYHAYTANLPVVGKRTAKVLWLGAGRFWTTKKGNQYYIGGALNHKAQLMKFKTGMMVPVNGRLSLGGEFSHSTFVSGRRGRAGTVFPRTALTVKGRVAISKNLDVVGRYTTGNAGRSSVLDTVQLGVSLKY